DAFISDPPTLSHSRTFVDVDAVGPVASSAIPMGMDRVRSPVPGLLVVGGAAGLATPFTGGRLRYALDAGELAARAIVAATRECAHGDPGVECASALHGSYGRVFRAGRWFARQISRPMVTSLAARYGTRVPIGSKAAIRFMIDAG